ncbi:MAG: peptidylprolyl isomerase [Rhodospirillales bacterium]|nr:peptidylprolyl isomerase [Rhodospirillales bacterium]
MLIVCAVAAVSVRQSWAQDSLRIAAVVNDDVITLQDLESRVSLLLATSNLERTAENRRRFRGHALRSLVDEQLKMQEAERLGVRIERAEVDRALSQIASQFRLPPSQFAQFLEQNSVSMNTLRDQVEAELLWVKAVSGQMRGKITITDDEVASRLDQMSREAGTPEYRVAEIFLPVQDSEKEPEVRNLADGLVQQILSGASFPALARNFSQGASAANGGDLGYVRLEQLPTEVQDVVTGLSPGQMSPPVRSTDGYHIIALINMRVAQGPQVGAIQMTLSQLIVALPPNPTPQDVDDSLARARNMAANAATCGDLDALAGEDDVVTAGSVGSVTLAQMEEPLRGAVRSLTVGQKSAPIRTAEGVTVLMVCDRRDDSVDADLHESIRKTLLNERLTAAARRILRDLQREAFIDVRI